MPGGMELFHKSSGIVSAPLDRRRLLPSSTSFPGGPLKDRSILLAKASGA
jgi:hypothetical protein